MGMVNYEIKEEIALITLNRPERLNAYDKTFFDEMPKIWKQFRDDKNAKVAIITGAEEKAFCVGYDLKGGELSLDELKKSPMIVPTSHNIWKPIIAAVRGYCVAGGFWIASSCDLRVAAANSEFGIPEAKSNIFSVLNVPDPMYHNLPPAIVLELAFVGDRISARRLYEIGFLNRVVPSENVMETAIELARKICINGQLSIKMGKELFYKSKDMNRAQIEDLNWKMQEEFLKR
ncbi:MAG TPA: enoyl-CoA hydratase/isomerase family protein [Desulfobacteraceae bacterium]|nr:enoyl-CoA hydratase/isomerase family protein [Desulfobacteraceae bacterium]